MSSSTSSPQVVADADMTDAYPFFKSKPPKRKAAESKSTATSSASHSTPAPEASTSATNPNPLVPYDDSSTDGEASDWAAAHSNNVAPSDSEPEAEASSSSRSKGKKAVRKVTTDTEKMTIADNGTADKGTAENGKSTPSKKRSHADANASDVEAAPAPPKKKSHKKRVRISENQRRAPACHEELPLPNGELAAFASSIYIIQLGSSKRQFHAHEAAINRSPTFRDAIQKARSAKRTTKHNFLPLMSHDPIAFEQMLHYLYNDKVKVTNTKTSSFERLAELQQLMNIAHHYQLPGMQKHVVKLFSNSKIVKMITPATFFDWSEDMYHDELDHENGAFKNFFARVAPGLLRTRDVEFLREVGRMVRQGGGFAEEIWKATHAAMLESQNVIKQEEDAVEEVSGVPAT